MLFHTKSPYIVPTKISLQSLFLLHTWISIMLFIFKRKAFTDRCNELIILPKKIDCVTFKILLGYVSDKYVAHKR